MLICSEVKGICSRSSHFLKSENKVANQIDLFEDATNLENDIVIKVEDWKFEERLSKEFEAVGFFISDHPLNQFKEIFDDYKIIDFIKFNSDNTCNIYKSLRAISNDIGVIKWYKLNKKRNNIKNTISNLKNQESILKNEINKLQTDSNYIKILAQEKFYMVKKGEKVFRVINKTSNE